MKTKLTQSQKKHAKRTAESIARGELEESCLDDWQNQHAADSVRRRLKGAKSRVACQVRLEEQKVRDEEKAIQNGEPHWPTYHAVINTAQDFVEYHDARRYRDAGDIIAFQERAEDFAELLNLIHIDDFAAKIRESVLKYKKVSEKQLKCLALGAAKGKTEKLIAEKMGVENA